MTYPTDYADPYGVYPIDLDPSDLLKPCPFCGETATLWEGVTVENDCFVKCDWCGARTEIYYSRKDKAIEAWNRRAKDENNMSEMRGSRYV